MMLIKYTNIIYVSAPLIKSIIDNVLIIMKRIRIYSSIFVGQWDYFLNIINRTIHQTRHSAKERCIPCLVLE